MPVSESSPSATPADSLRDAFSQTHNAVQWLARIVRSFTSLNANNDIALYWDEVKNAFVTDEFANSLQLELRLPELTLQFLEDGKPAKHELHMEGRSPAQVEAWVLVELLHRGVDRERFSKDLPYDIPNQMVGDSVEYSPEFREGELKQILGWLAAATELMKTLVKKSDRKRAGQTGLVLRSRDFSLEASIPLIGQTDVTDRSIRVGFCPLRQGIVDPHYFVVRSEPVKKGSEVIEIIKVSGTKPSDIAGPAVAKRLKAVVAKAQMRAAQ
jgi:hypothetical protein